MNDPIVAIATPPGRGGVGVVRISGVGLDGWLEVLSDTRVQPRRATFGRFLNGDGASIDEGILLFFPGPASFTGEDVIELQAHGSPVVLDMLVRRSLQLGARLARPGEFSERAFYNGKLDLVQAEAVADLVAAESEAAARAALASLCGEFSQRIALIRDRLVELRVLLEAGLDFSDQEIDFVGGQELGERLAALRLAIVDLLAQANQGSLLREGFRVAIAGRPNAGKSSLMNAVSGLDAAIVTDVPGTTRDIIREAVNIEGIPFHLSDTAGLRDSSDPVEREGIRRAQAELERADRVLLVIDSQMESKAEISDFIAGQLASCVADRRLTLVFNKSDLSGMEPGYQGGDPPQVVLSATTGEGLAALQRHLVDIAGGGLPVEGRFMARRRHLVALEAALVSICNAEQLGPAALPELLAEELRQAQRELGSITGEFSSDDLLGEIFAGFCIGK